MSIAVIIPYSTALGPKLGYDVLVWINIRNKQIY